jgi:hypothetical protein
MNKWTERFALQLIKDNGHLESFMVDLGSYADTGEIAQLFRSQGCLVSIHPVKCRLDVTCGLPPLV